MYDYYLFDLDGTLIKSETGIFNCIRYALDWAGIPYPSEEVFKSFIGPSLHFSFTTNFHMNDEQAKTMVAKYRERYNTVGLYETEIYDGLYETLEELKKRGAKLAVATSKPTGPSEKILERFELSGYFDVVVGSNPDGTGSDKKDIINEALRRLKSQPAYSKEEAGAVMIGDRFYDIKGGQACGIDTAGVLYGYGTKEEFEEAGATHIVNTPQDILKI